MEVFGRSYPLNGKQSHCAPKRHLLMQKHIIRRIDRYDRSTRFAQLTILPSPRNPMLCTGLDTPLKVSLPTGASALPWSHLIHGSLGPPDSASYTASLSVQPFLHRSRQRVPILVYVTMGRPFSPLKMLLPMEDMNLHLIQWFFELFRAHNPNGISIGSAIFTGLTTVSHRQTDRQTILQYTVCNNRPQVVRRCRL